VGGPGRPKKALPRGRSDGGGGGEAAEATAARPMIEKASIMIEKLSFIFDFSRFLKKEDPRPLKAFIFGP